MTDTNPQAEPRTLDDCWGDAVLLAGLIDAIDLLRCGSTSPFASNAAAAVTDAARERAHRLADSIDRALLASRSTREVGPHCV